MNYRFFFFISLIYSTLLAQAQNDMPKDFLSSTFHKERRQALRKRMPNNSVAVFFANPIRNRSNDVDYVYHQDPNFLYFTGYREPHAVLFIFKDYQTSENGERYNEIFFIQPRNPSQEMWTGRRLGVDGVKKKLQFNQVFDNTDFEAYNIDFTSFDQILFDDFVNDVRDDTDNPSDLYDLIRLFKAKVNYSTKGEVTIALEKQKNNLNTTDLNNHMNVLRGIKTKEEIEMIRRAVDISCQGQIEVMKAIRPSMSEREIQGIHEFVFKKYQAEDLGYPSIVGAGHNGCILHYIDNYKPKTSSKELILMDLGAEYHGYTADITRTIPIDGTFSKEQKLIYNIVLDAQEAAMKICKPKTTFTELYMATRKAVNVGLHESGIIASVEAKHTYYPHGCCHHIGLDVHDKGTREALEENMTFTIEPGIYIPEGSPCDKRWWGIAVRIEDDFLTTANGCTLLSASAPRTIKDIEAMMKQHSPLDDFLLPPLEK